MWLAAVEWGVVGPILMGIATLTGAGVAAWERIQKRRALERKNGQLTGAFALINELQEQLREEWEDKKTFRQTIRDLQRELHDSFEVTAGLTRQLREAQTTADQLYDENQDLKRKAST